MGRGVGVRYEYVRDACMEWYLKYGVREVDTKKDYEGISLDVQYKLIKANLLEWKLYYNPYRPKLRLTPKALELIRS